jgi:hypothetical protein
MATTTKSQGVLNPTSTGRTKEEIFTLKNKIAEVINNNLFQFKNDFILFFLFSLNVKQMNIKQN